MINQKTSPYFRRSYMIVMGLRNPENDEINEKNKLNVISAVGKDPGIDKKDFRKHIDKINAIGGAKNGSLSVA